MSENEKRQIERLSHLVVPPRCEMPYDVTAKEVESHLEQLNQWLEKSYKFLGLTDIPTIEMKDVEKEARKGTIYGVRFLNKEIKIMKGRAMKYIVTAVRKSKLEISYEEAYKQIRIHYKETVEKLSCEKTENIQDAWNGKNRNPIRQEIQVHL